MSMETRDGYIWSDGKLIPWSDARLHMFSYTVQHGAGVFEGTRAYRGDRGTSVFRLADHVERLMDSAKILQMPLKFSREQLVDAHVEAIKANQLDRAYLRTNVFYDGTRPGVSAVGNDVHVFIAAWTWDAYLGPDAHNKGIRVKTSSISRLHINSALCKAKANGHYINSMLAIHEAKQAGFDDALMLDTQGYVAECSTSNLFMIRRGRIATPERTAILAGITRDTVMTLAADRGLKVEERKITRDELYCADEIFVTGTAAEISPIVELDYRTIGSGAPGPITSHLRTAFFAATCGDDPKHMDWLTPVA